MNNHETINYLEIPATDLPATKAFFEKVFNWRFEDYGDEYTAFTEKRLKGGFYKSEKKSSTKNGAVLVIFYSADLESSENKIKKAGGKIIKPIFSFPGGRRFHFTEPSGNEFSVWTDK